jgi:hypothetical protein
MKSQSPRHFPANLASSGVLAVLPRCNCNAEAVASLTSAFNFPMSHFNSGGYSRVVSEIISSSKDENLCDVLKRTSGTMLCRAQFIVKSHKNPGRVVFKMLHSSLGHKYIPLAKRIVHMVRPRLKALSHIYSDSISMLRAMREVRITNRTLLVMADVKDFYLSGNPEFLAHSLSSFPAAADRHSVICATLHILSHQYLQMGDSNVQCNTGAGMGFLFSGEVADAGFYREVEEWGPCNAAHACAKHILFYGRYRDDLLFIIEEESLGIVARACTSLSNYFKIDSWECSQYASDHLDVELYKHQGCTQITHRPRFKETSLGVSISPSSNHPPRIHRAWMSSEIKRFARLSSTLEDFICARSIFVHRLSGFHVGQDLLDIISNLNPFLCRLVGTVRIFKRPKPAGKPLVIQVPYHLLLYHSEVPTVAREFLDQGKLEVISTFCHKFHDFSLRIAWLNNSSHLYLMARWQKTPNITNRRRRQGAGWWVVDDVDVRKFLVGWQMAA